MMKTTPILTILTTTLIFAITSCIDNYDNCQKIKEGMTTTEVISIMGQPMKIDTSTDLSTRNLEYLAVALAAGPIEIQIDIKSDSVTNIVCAAE